MSPSPLRVNTKISAVQVFRSGAIVQRVGTVTPSKEGYVISGLPLILRDGSVRLAVTGGVGASPSGLTVSLESAATLTDLRSEHERKVSLAERTLQDLDRRVRALEDEYALLQRFEFTIARARGTDRPLPTPLRLWTELLDWRRSHEERLGEEKLALHDQRLEAAEALARLRRDAEKSYAERDQQGLCKRVSFRIEGLKAESAEVILDYHVAGARWAPAYVLRVAEGGARATLERRALVAQATREDWDSVALSLSTASLDATPELPELRSIRLGRVQAEAARFRAPPNDLHRLFADYDAFSESLSEPSGETSLHPSPVPIPIGSPMPATFLPPAAALQFSAPGGGPSELTFRSGAAPVAAAPPPAAPQSAGRFGKSSARVDPSDAPTEEQVLGLQETGGSAAASFSPLDYAALRMMGPSTALRGQLRESRSEDPLMQEAQRHVRHIRSEANQMNIRSEANQMNIRSEANQMNIRSEANQMNVRSEANQMNIRSEANQMNIRSEANQMGTTSPSFGEAPSNFDYRFEVVGPSAVSSDARPHNLLLSQSEVPLDLTLVVAPQQSPLAIRLAHWVNNTGAPLLGGTADVYWGDQFLVQSPLRTTPSGGRLMIGLGVEPGLKVARHTSFTERSATLLRGAVGLEHAVRIEVCSRLTRTVAVEVRERLPTLAKGHDEIEITVNEVTPAWEPFAQEDMWRIEGGKRWQLQLPAGESRELSYAYTIRIDSNKELVGGNRRQ